MPQNNCVGQGEVPKHQVPPRTLSLSQPTLETTVIAPDDLESRHKFSPNIPISISKTSAVIPSSSSSWPLPRSPWAASSPHPKTSSTLAAPPRSLPTNASSKLSRGKDSHQLLTGARPPVPGRKRSFRDSRRQGSTTGPEADHVVCALPVPRGRRVCPGRGRGGYEAYRLGHIVFYRAQDGGEEFGE